MPPGETTVPPLDATTDLGWSMRNLISRVRPIATIPYGATWQAPATDPAGLPGPWCIDSVSSIAPGIATTVEEDGHTPTNAATAGIRVPLYDTIMRLNLRDGLWYERGESGNMPLAWDDVNQVWVPRYDPTQWEELGVGSDHEEPPPISWASLRLNGTSGTYVRTADANYFDYQQRLHLRGRGGDGRLDADRPPGAALQVVDHGRATLVLLGRRCCGRPGARLLPGRHRLESPRR